MQRWRTVVTPEGEFPQWLREGSRHIWRPYCQHATASAPLAVIGSEGSRLRLADGREVVDGTASWWTAAHGYSHAHIQERVQSQLLQLPHIAFGGLAHEAAYSLAFRLAALLPGTLNKVFFSESGSVAVEVAMKMALQSFVNRGEPARQGVVCFEGAYHGDTFGTMALCDPTGMHAGFNRFSTSTVRLPLPVNGNDDFEQALSAVSDSVACVVVEPLVQCAGGMLFHDTSQLRRIRRACDESGLILIFDEIATGFYRTGERFALAEADVLPDIVVLGKALTGGTLPMAATIATDAIFDTFLSNSASAALQHGPTYMGNALACAAAHASLDLFEADDMAQRVARLSQSLRDGLNPLVGQLNVLNVRVKGGIAAIDVPAGKAPPSDAFVARGAFVRPLRSSRSDVIYLTPPLNIEEQDLAVLVRAVNGAVADIP